MIIDLIPVIEIGYKNQGTNIPDKFPYWDNPNLWDEYRRECFKKAGFQDILIPYLAGSSFFELHNISDDNLKKLVIDHTQDMRDGKYDRDQACGFFGGYVLRVNKLDKYFPQCCGELSDITYWERVSSGQSSYYEGHPAPQLRFDQDYVIFDFSVGEYDEPFQPTPPQIKLVVDKNELREALERAKIKLKEFEKRIEKINFNENLSINDIGGLLIWNNANYE